MQQEKGRKQRTRALKRGKALLETGRNTEHLKSHCNFSLDASAACATAAPASAFLSFLLDAASGLLSLPLPCSLAGGACATADSDTATGPAGVDTFMLAALCRKRHLTPCLQLADRFQSVHSAVSEKGKLLPKTGRNGAAFKSHIRTFPLTHTF